MIDTEFTNGQRKNQNGASTAAL